VLFYGQPSLGGSRHGVDIPRQPLARWVIQSGEQLQPLLNLMRDKLLDYPVLHCDETRLQVLHEPGRDPSAQSWMWVQSGGPPDKPVILFDYTASRAQEVLLRLLDGYRGYLMTDDYAGYNAVAARDGIERLGCCAHARRKFVEAQKVQPKGKTGRADVALTSATGWSYSFTLLRLAPALIWESGERPALFAGTVAIDTTPAETNGSAPGTPPAVVGQPAPEGQESPPWECPRSDTALPTAAPPVPDVMEDMLAMVGLDGTADMGKGEYPVEKVPANHSRSVSLATYPCAWTCINSNSRDTIRGAFHDVAATGSRRAATHHQRRQGARAYGERHRLPSQSQRVPALCAGTSPGGCAGQAGQATGLAVGAKALLETAATPQAPKWPEHLDL